MILNYILLGLLCLELTTILVYGGFVNKYLYTYLINDIKKENIRLSTFNHKTLVLGNFYVHYLPFSLLAKYYVAGFGIVFRFSKLHKKINEYYTIAN